MKQTIICLCLALQAVQLAHSTGGDPDLARFAFAKETQARQFEAELTNKVPSITWSFFDAVKVDDWQTATNLASRLQHATGLYSKPSPAEFSEALRSPVWQTISETLGAYEQFHDWDKKWLRRFGKEIIESIPKGSIYFGGTDPGRFLITTLSESHREGKPFFTITQNQLADRTYLDYIQKMYGKQLYIPNAEDSQQAIQQYLSDAQERLKANKLKPGEDVQIVNNRVQVSGQVAVMTINGLLAKIIAEKNSGRGIYVEESFPLDWMYPQLSPHGLIMKLEAKPLFRLREEEVQKDQDYWKQLMIEIFGDVITQKTTVKDVCDFAGDLYLRKKLDGFKGDRGFIKNDSSQKTFSKLRSSIGGLYAWRADQATDSEERARMQKAAELSFRQAFVLCPSSPEAVFRYTQLLSNMKRYDDAILIVKTAMRFTPDSTQLAGLLKSLRRYSN